MASHTTFLSRAPGADRVLFDPEVRTRRNSVSEDTIIRRRAGGDAWQEDVGGDPELERATRPVWARPACARCVWRTLSHPPVRVHRLSPGLGGPNFGSAEQRSGASKGGTAMGWCRTRGRPRPQPARSLRRPSPLRIPWAGGTTAGRSARRVSGDRRGRDRRLNACAAAARINACSRSAARPVPPGPGADAHRLETPPRHLVRPEPPLPALRRASGESALYVVRRGIASP